MRPISSGTYAVRPRGWPIQSAIDQALFDLTHLPIREWLRHAELISFMCMRSPPAGDGGGMRPYADVMDEICPRVSVALLHSTDDDAVSHECSKDIAIRNPGVRLALYPSGAHFMQFREPEPLARDIRDFIHQLEAHRP